MNVRKLLKRKDIINHQVKGITDNSKDVKGNYIFFAIKGSNYDGHNYIDEAIKNGAKTIIVEQEIELQKGINYIIVDDTKKYLAEIANKYYKNISKKINLYGITGTNGKTTISTLLFNFYMYNGIKSALIGTEGIIIDLEKYKTNNTTPNILIILKTLKRAKKKHIKDVFMEVSSHAIKELRIYGLCFKGGIFSNLTPEHLDYHKNMIDYKYTKGRFIQSIKGKKSFVVLNKDSSMYKLYNQLAESEVISYSINERSQYKAININKTNDKKTVFTIANNNHKEKVKTSLIGLFNVYNILAVYAFIRKIGFEATSFSRFLRIYAKLDGRMEVLKYGNKTIIIDFAHTPDSVDKVIRSLREYDNEKIIVVIGCGGNRDKEKRPKIGFIATELADYVFFTNDNPRDENEKEIINDILAGVRKNNFEVIYNRKEAIKKALLRNKDKELIAILGKGNEMYQIINNEYHDFNDKEIVKKLIREGD